MSRAATLRIVVRRGVESLQREAAVESYRQGRISLGRAAEEANVPLTRFLDLLKQGGIVFRYNAHDLQEDLEWAGRD